MATLTGFLGLVGLAGVGFMLYAFGSLSQRLGAVALLRPYYRLFWISVVGVALAIGGRLLVIAGLVDNSNFLIILLIYYLPLAVGLSMGLFAVWYYWRWLLRE